MKFINRISCLILFSCGPFFIFLDAQNRFVIDSLNNALHHINSLASYKNDSLRVEILVELSKEYIIRNENDSIQRYAEKALQLAALINFKLGEANALGNLGVSYHNRGNFLKAIDCYKKAIDLSTQAGNKTGPARHLGNLGVVYENQGNHTMALECYFKALKMNEANGNKKGIAKRLGNIGAVYNALKEYDKGLEYFFRALKLDEELGNKKSIAVQLGNIGLCYSYQKKHGKALEFYVKALRMEEESGDKKGISRITGNMGIVYRDLGNYDLALSSFNKALRLDEQIGNIRNVALLLGNIGQLYAVQKKNTPAETYLLKALAVCDSIGILNEKKEFELSLSEVCSEKGNFKKALEHYRKYVVTGDSLTNIETTKKQTRLVMQYDFDKKSAADSIKNSEAKKVEEIKHQQEISKQRTFTYGGIAGFLVMIIVAGISYNAFRNKKKANVMIAQQKALVEEKQKEILDSIYYARRIQRALITSERYIEKNIRKLNRN